MSSESPGRPGAAETSTRGPRLSWALGAALALGAVANLYGVRARLPSASRTGRVLTAAETADLAAPMERAREEVYHSYKTPESIKDDVFERDPREAVELTVAGRVRKVRKTTLDSLRTYFLQPEFADDATVLYALSNIKPKLLQFDPRLYQYGGLYLYTIGFAMQMGEVFGLYGVTRDVKHYFLHPDELGLLYAMPRLVQIAATLAAGWVLFLIAGRFLRAERAGALAAFFLAAAPVVVVCNHMMKAHTFFLPFSLLGIYFALRAMEDRRTKSYVLSGVFTGLAAGAIFFGGFAFFSLLAAHWLGEPGKRGLRSFLDRRLVWAGLALAAAFFIVSPFQVLSLFAVAADAQKQAAGDMRLYLLPLNLIGHLFIDLPKSLGWGLWLLCALGLVQAARMRDRRHAVLLAGAVPLYALLSLMNEPGRYAMGIFPPLILVAMHALETWMSKGRGRRILAAVVAAGAVYTLGYALYYDAVLERGDPKPRAGAWINSHVPAGASVAARHRLVYGWGGYPPFRLLDYDLVRWDPALKKKPDYYLAVGALDRPGVEPPSWGDAYRPAAVFRRDFGWVDRIYGNRLLKTCEEPVTVFARRAAGPPSPG